MEGGGATELNWLSMEPGASTPHDDPGYTLSVTVMVTICTFVSWWVGNNCESHAYQQTLATPEYKVRSRIDTINMKEKYLKVLTVDRKFRTNSTNAKVNSVEVTITHVASFFFTTYYTNYFQAFRFVYVKGIINNE
jgi:hypothetical protein